MLCVFFVFFFVFFQAEDGIRDLVRSRGLGDVYKRQVGYGIDLDLCGVRHLFDTCDYEHWLPSFIDTSRYGIAF